MPANPHSIPTGKIPQKCNVRPAAVVSAALLTLALAACTPAPGVDSAQRISAPGQYAGYSQPVYDGYEQSSLYVPMRDGVRLAVDIFRPTLNGVVSDEKLPVVWMHTPYNRRTHRRGPTVSHYTGYAAELIPHGYVVAIADFRGVYASFGRNTGYNRGEWVEEAKWDAYDMTEWLASQPWSNGRVGMWGCSATGGSQMQALSVRPPSLKAVIPMSAEYDAYPVWTPGGAVRPESGVPQGGTTIAGRDAEAVPVDGPDGPALLEQAIASHAGSTDIVGPVPFRDSISPATGLKWWEVSSPSAYGDAIGAGGVGVMTVANWDEAGAKSGAFVTFNNLAPGHGKLLVGPERHCNWDIVRSDYGFDLVVEELRFFDYWLKGIDNGVMDEPAVTYFAYNAPEGSQWRQSAAWPLANETRTDFFLGGGELLATAPEQAATHTGVHDAPAVSSIFIGPAANGAVYETAPLQAGMEVTGHPVLDLWVSTNARDLDVTARIDEVAPDGETHSYQMTGRLRASHRKTSDAPFNNLGLPWRAYTQAGAEPLPSGEPVLLSFDLLPMSYIFREGHRIRLHVSFADPATGAANAAYHVNILEGGDTPSRLVLPVIPAQ